MTQTTEITGFADGRALPPLENDRLCRLILNNQEFFGLKPADRARTNLRNEACKIAVRKFNELTYGSHLSVEACLNTDEYLVRATFPNAISKQLGPGYNLQKVLENIITGKIRL